MSATAFWTVGHSTHTLEAFIALLQAHEVDAVADVRRFPRSRTNPQFNVETLPSTLAAHRIAYRHIAALGGRRSRASKTDVSPNTFWENAAFRAYADYAATDEFRAGLDELLAFGAGRRCAVMCSEALWWRCHRRIIADYLLARGARVIHILANGKAEAAKLTQSARPMPDGMLVYPAPQSA